MAARRLMSSPAMSRQTVITEFAGLKSACPAGIFMCLTPGNATLWTGVLFVRKGPYATAILRFHVSFPADYPRLPPLITFATDIFHPLLTPLSTLTYTTDIQDSGTVSATDDERLPPGGFSLRHGFPAWFNRSTRSLGVVQKQRIYIIEVLEYIKSTFEDETVLDSIPVEAAGNAGAWHAWRAYRSKFNTTSNTTTSEPHTQADKRPSAPEARQPGEWNWDGVWETRARRGIAASLADSALYANAGAGDDLVCLNSNCTLIH